MSGISNTTSITSIANSSLGNFSNNQIAEEVAEATTVSSMLNKSDAVQSTISTGSVPASRVSLANRISNTTSSIANGTVNATREMGRVITNDVMPKPEPLSATLVRNKFLSAVLVGGFVNGVTTLLKVSQGEYTPDQAKHEMVKNTGMGAVSGLTFASGMGLTATVLGKAVTGVPLSLAALTIGTVASYFSTEFIKDHVSFFSDNKTA